MAIEDATRLVRQTGDLPVPLHIRNAPTPLMKSLDYGKDYLYSHSFEQNFAPQEYLPDSISGTRLYSPQGNPTENKIQERILFWWQDKYK